MKKTVLICQESEMKKKLVIRSNEKYRMASWWIKWEDLIYPDKGIEEKIKRKAEKFKQAGVNTAIIFGAHFRWDFIYIWDRLHLLIRFTADELHKRDIQLFDHHSAVLTHRIRNEKDRWDIWQKNRHHVPFYPSGRMAEELKFNGNSLKDWRMINIRTGEPCYLPQYNAESFCMNNPDFRNAYIKYLKILISETGIDGLMCDDAVFYPGWESCGCQYCRKKFKEEFKEKLPSWKNKNFWGNMESESFKKWIRMRYKSTSDFLFLVKKAIGTEFPLMSCCSTSSSKSLNRSGMNAKIFARVNNHLMLEMCGEILDEDGRLTHRIPNLMLHLGIAKKHTIPSIGLGYAFYPQTSFIVWALNKLIGTGGTWISSLKGRLGLPESQLKMMPEEEDIVGEGYNWEKKYPFLFTDEHIKQVAVYFSLETLVYYGDSEEDYAVDYRRIVSLLFEDNIQFDVVTDPEQIREFPILILASVNCLSKKEKEIFNRYLEDGGIILACGPIGMRDERGYLSEKGWLSNYGLNINMKEPNRGIELDDFFDLSKGAPERKVSLYCRANYKGQKINREKWININKGKGKFFWIPGRISITSIQKKILLKLSSLIKSQDYLLTTPEGWYYRFFKGREKEINVHFLYKQFNLTYDQKIKNEFIGRQIIKSVKVDRQNKTSLVVNSNIVRKAKLFSPDLTTPLTGHKGDEGIDFDLSDVRRCFVLNLLVK